MKLLKPLFFCALTAILATSCRSQDISTPPQILGNNFVWVTNVPQRHFTLNTNTQVILVSGGTDASSTNDIYIYSASLGYFTNVNGTYFLGTSNQLAGVNTGYSNTGFSAICSPGFGGHQPFIYTNALNALTGTNFIFDNYAGNGGLLTNSHPVAAYQITTNYP